MILALCLLTLSIWEVKQTSSENKENHLPVLGLFLSTGCRQNLRAENRDSWLDLVGDHLVKDNKRFLGYASTIIRYLNHIKLSK